MPPECAQERNVASGFIVTGARVALGPGAAENLFVQIAGSRVARISISPPPLMVEQPAKTLDLTGYLLLPGLINAHDHLEFALFPRLADPPYRNYIEWGDDIHRKYPDVIARCKAVPKPVRMWWGGIRNLLCGVTTVCHHNPLWPELQRPDFPVRVVNAYGWAHSVALGGDISKAHTQTPAGRPFFLHACEGVDDRMRAELVEIDALGLLDEHTVLIHGLALDHEGVARLQERGSSLILCPSSNVFLFGQLPDFRNFASMPNLALGSDSPLTAEGDLLDEVRFAIQACGIPSGRAYRMITAAPAAMLRLQDSEGFIQEGGVADLIAIRDTGHTPSQRLKELSSQDIECVIISGRVCLASDDVLGRLPNEAVCGLEPVCADEVLRWVRAPVGDLLRKAEEFLGEGNVRLGSRRLRAPAAMGVMRAS